MYHLLTLGGLALRDADGRLVQSSVRGRSLALLALLARAGAAGMTRERLAAYLWPESDAARARHSLDQALYMIRRALDADPFVSAAAMLTLDGGVMDSDVAAFEGALAAGETDRAVDRYGGAFLDGFHLSGAPEFERWVDAERSELHGKYTAALEALAREASEAGDAGGAVVLWQRLAAESPLSSRVALELMRALDRAGDRAKALQVARVHAALVEEELGAPPDAAVLGYAEDLAGGRPAKVPEPAEPGAPTVPAAGAGLDPPAPTIPGAGGGTSGAGRRRRVRPLWLLLGLVTGLVLVVAVAPAVPDAEPARPRVVVGPFENESGEAALDALGPMTSDWVTEALVRTGIVAVVQPGSRDAAVRSAVEGRIYLRGDSVWIRAHIVDPANGAVQRSLEAVGAPASDPTPALEPLRQRVLGALGTLYDPRISAWGGTALRPPSWAAYQEFAAGVELHAVPRDLPGAVEHFRRAGELDPHYTLPRLWLTWARLLMEDYAGADSVARSLVRRRGEMSPLERAWHDRITALLAGDSEATYQAARRMVEIAPGSGWVISLASAALDTRRPEVAIDALRETGIDNLGLEREHGWSLLAAANHMVGDYQAEMDVVEEAIASDGLDWGFVGAGVPALAAVGRVEALERRLEELRGLPPAYGAPRGPASALAAVTELRAHGFLAAAESLGSRLLDRPDLRWDGVATAEPGRWHRLQLLYELGRWDEASALLDTVQTGEADFRLTALAGLLAARTGDVATARALDSSLAAIDGPYLFGEAPLWRARIHAVLGEREAAVRLVRQAFSEGIGSRGWHRVHTTRDFEPLRGAPELVGIMRPGRPPG